MWNHDVSDTKEVERMAALYDEDGTRAIEPGAEVETGRNLVRRCGKRALGKLLADTRFEDMFGLPAAINPMEAAVAEAQGKLMEWKNSDRDYSRYYCDDASAYLTEYSDIGRDIMAPLLRLIDELIDDGTLDEAGVHENPVAAIGSMLAEAALEHARADLEYFDQDFRERAVDGINECAVARTIAEAVPAAKLAEEEPAQSRGPKH